MEVATIIRHKDLGTLKIYTHLRAENLANYLGGKSNMKTAITLFMLVLFISNPSNSGEKDPLCLLFGECQRPVEKDPLCCLLGECQCSVEKEFTERVLYPKGDGPFPVMILSHGKGGPSRQYNRVANSITSSSGFATIVLDHYSVRGLFSRGPKSNFTLKEADEYRLKDILDVLKNLKNKPKINRKKIILAGWSAGSGMVLPIISNPKRVDIPEDVSIAGAILTYPYTYGCYSEIESFNVPVLMLYGKLDGNDGDPLSGVHCWKEKISEFEDNKHPVTLKLFDDAYHLFDFPKLRNKRCHPTKYRDGLGELCTQFNHKAYELSKIEMKKFLSQMRDN